MKKMTLIALIAAMTFGQAFGQIQETGKKAPSAKVAALKAQIEMIRVQLSGDNFADIDTKPALLERKNLLEEELRKAEESVGGESKANSGETAFVVLFSLADKKLSPISGVTHDFLSLKHSQQAYLYKYRGGEIEGYDSEMFLTLVAGAGDSESSNETKGGFGIGLKFSFKGGKSNLFVGQWLEEMDATKNRWAIGFSIK